MSVIEGWVLRESHHGKLVELGKPFKIKLTVSEFSSIIKEDLMGLLHMPQIFCICCLGSLVGHMASWSQKVSSLHAENVNCFTWHYLSWLISNFIILVDGKGEFSFQSFFSFQNIHFLLPSARHSSVIISIKIKVYQKRGIQISHSLVDNVSLLVSSDKRQSIIFIYTFIFYLWRYLWSPANLMPQWTQYRIVYSMQMPYAYLTSIYFTHFIFNNSMKPTKNSSQM